MNKDQVKKLLIFFLSIVALVSAIILYAYLNSEYNFGFYCITNKIFGIYCSGCGLTRAAQAMLNLDFYQAFRYNALSFIILPMIFLLIIMTIWEWLFKKTNIFLKIPVWVWIVLCIVIVVFGIVRNFIPYLQPTKI